MISDAPKKKWQDTYVNIKPITPRKSHYRYTKQQEQLIIDMDKIGDSVEAIALALDRETEPVRQKMYRLRRLGRMEDHPCHDHTIHIQNAKFILRAMKAVTHANKNTLSIVVVANVDTFLEYVLPNSEFTLFRSNNKRHLANAMNRFTLLSTDDFLLQYKEYYGVQLASLIVEASGKQQAHLSKAMTSTQLRVRHGMYRMTQIVVIGESE